MNTKKGATLVGSLFAITILSTTLVSALNLQASIIRAKFFLQYDNTANLLVAEGLEIVRFLDAADSIDLPNDLVYAVDYETDALPTTQVDPATCVVDNTCGLAIPAVASGYKLTIAPSIFYRFINIEQGPSPTVTSTVIVRNPQNGSTRTYRAVMKLY